MGGLVGGVQSKNDIRKTVQKNLEGGGRKTMTYWEISFSRKAWAKETGREWSKEVRGW